MLEQGYPGHYIITETRNVRTRLPHYIINGKHQVTAEEALGIVHVHVRTSPTLYLPESVRTPQVLRVVLDYCNTVIIQEKGLA